jgi:hypothetical protein
MPSTHIIFLWIKNTHISKKQILKFKYPVALTQLFEMKAHNLKVTKVYLLQSALCLTSLRTFWTHFACCNVRKENLMKQMQFLKYTAS